MNVESRYPPLEGVGTGQPQPPISSASAPPPAYAPGVHVYAPQGQQPNTNQMPLQIQQQPPPGQHQIVWIQQQPQKVVVMAGPRAWTYGLCGCCDDCESMCLVTWCPCIAAGKIYEALGSGKQFGVGVVIHLTIFWLPFIVYVLTEIPLHLIGAFIYPAVYTGPLRRLYNIAGNYCGDCICIAFCGCCQMTRELREVKYMEALKAQQNAPQTVVI